MMTEKDFEGELLEVLISNKFCDQLTYGSCDTDDCILVYADKAIQVTHVRIDGEDGDEDGGFEFKKIEHPDRTVFSYAIRPSENEHIIFKKFYYESDNLLQGIKFRWDESYLTVFTTWFNLIITKSIIDLTGEDKYDELPDEDPSYFIIHTDD